MQCFGAVLLRNSSSFFCFSQTIRTGLICSFNKHCVVVRSTLLNIVVTLSFSVCGGPFVCEGIYCSRLLQTIGVVAISGSRHHPVTFLLITVVMVGGGKAPSCAFVHPCVGGKSGRSWPIGAE